METTAELPREIVDLLVNPRSFEDLSALDEALGWVRREMPLAVARHPDYRPFWLISRYHDLRDASRRNDTFLNGAREVQLFSLEGEAVRQQASGGGTHIYRALTRMDGREHSEHRRLTQGWFMPSRVKQLEPVIRGMAVKLIDRMIAMGGECDFVQDVALIYPLHVIMTILGMPEQDEPLMLRLTQALFGANDPEFSNLQDGKTPAERGVEAISEFMAYFEKVTADRRANPRDDLASVIANARIGGEYLDYPALMGYYIIAATAGHDTTSYTLSEGALALAERPDLLVRLRDQPKAMGGFIEETIRWASPVKHFMRTATCDTELGGQKISQGDWLMLCYHSANRDESVFDDPFTFNIDRTPNEQVGFGYGGHQCLGQHLARLELRIFWEEFVARVSGLDLSAPGRRTVSNFVTGLKTLPIRFLPA